MDLDELLAARLVTFLMDNYQEILKVPLALQTSIEERVAHLRRVQVKMGHCQSYKIDSWKPSKSASLLLTSVIRIKGADVSKVLTIDLGMY